MNERRTPPTQASCTFPTSKILYKERGTAADDDYDIAMVLDSQDIMLCLLCRFQATVCRLGQGIEPYVVQQHVDVKPLRTACGEGIMAMRTQISRAFAIVSVTQSDLRAGLKWIGSLYCVSPMSFSPPGSGGSDEFEFS